VLKNLGNNDPNTVCDRVFKANDQCAPKNTVTNGVGSL